MDGGYRQRTNRRSIGMDQERAAAAHLEANGYQIICCNYRCYFGEIDLIARDGPYLVFAEIKYRRLAGSGYPAEAVNLRKQRVICRVADYYRMKEGIAEDMPCRFDVVAILGGQIELYQDAYSYMEQG